MTAASSGSALAAEGQAGGGRPSSVLPPVGTVGVIALILIVIGGIYMSSFYARHVSLVVPVILAIAAGIALIYAIVSALLARALVRSTFFKVLKWTLLLYVVVAGMLEYVFVYDGTRGNILVILTAMLVIFAVDVPMIISFTVAKYVGETGR